MTKYLLLLLLFCSCTRYQQRQVYVNRSGYLKLFLYQDSAYRFRFPGLFGEITEYGRFGIRQDTLILSCRLRDGSWNSRHFKYNSDSIIVNGLDPKVMGTDVQVLRQ